MMSLCRLFTCERGAAAAEMALIAPLAVLIIFSSLETGHYFYQQHQVVKGVRDGARYAARQSFDDINCRNDSPSISGTVAANIRLLTRTGQIASTTAAPRIPNWTDSDTVTTITVTCPDAPEAEDGIFRPTEPAPQVNIVATPAYDSLFNGLGIITDNVTLRGEQQAVVMGI